MKISPETWKKIEPLLARGLELPPAERQAWIASLHESRPDVAPLLARMLATHDRAERSHELETVPKLAPAPSRFAPGDVVGPYRLQRPIGRGGMGEVWHAAQVDGRLEREIALKLPTSLEAGDLRAERFRRERDILARLEHPNIARLYDAGASEAGQPYLAMEFVEGVALDTYVARERLPIPARLAIFRQVLAAVAHAHRFLVVHRDLKPANILIDGRGQVKLLDFGIAKLVEDEGAPGVPELTRLGGRVLTLRYAAPEQVAEGTITTATDIYALGVVLHELLAEASPYRAVREAKPLTDLMLLREEIARPSSLHKGIDADLDAIVLKALRRDPAARYATVEAFDDDIQRHLERRPVRARAGTWRYLAGRFARRHRLPLAMAAAVIVTLAAGLVVAERERRTAIAERARAERHFASVRRLANTFVFDVHGEIENLAGSLKARQKLVGTALEYLDTLGAESRDDTALALEVAGAYRRLAEIQGDSRGAHLGDPGGASANAAKAAAILDAVLAREPDNLPVLRERRVLALFIGRLRLEGGDKDGVADTQKAVAIAERIPALPGATRDDRRDLGASLAEYGGILAVVKDDPAGARQVLSRATQALESLAAENPADLATRARLAYAYDRACVAEEIAGDPASLRQAVLHIDRSVATTEGVVRDAGADISHARTLVKRYNNAARVKLRTDDVAGARESALKGLALVQQLADEDPRNVGNATMRVSLLVTAGEVELRDGNARKASDFSRQALAANAALPANTRAGLVVRETEASARWTLGSAQCALAAKGSPALREEARAMLQEARAFKRELVERGIDARGAARAIEEIDAGLARCGK